MELVIRKAVPGDLDAAEQIVKQAIIKMTSSGIDQWDELYPNREILSSDIDSGGMHILLLSGSPAAIIVLNEKQDKAYEQVLWNYQSGRVLVIHRLCVKPDAQGQGFAKRMVAFAQEYAMAHGYDAIRLDAFPKNPHALRLYESLGYEKAGVASFRKGDFYCYEKRIK